MPVFRNNQQGLIQPAVIIGAILMIGVILAISNFNKTPKSSGSWLYKVDLTKCQAIVDRAQLNNELEVVTDPEVTWQHRCGLTPKQSSIDAFSLKEVTIDAIYDEQGVIDPVGNAAKFKSKDPIVDFVAAKYVGKSYNDIFQEPDAINANFVSYEWGLKQGYEKMTQGTFITTEGKGAYFIIDQTRSDQTVQGYISYAHAKKGSCNIVMMTEITYDDSKRAKLEEQLVGMMQKIDEGIKGECGKVQSSSTTQPSSATSTPAPYASCAWDCADQVEAKYQCPIKLPLDDCGADKTSYQLQCQNTCWDGWGSPPEPKLNEGGPQIQKIEYNGRTALLIVNPNWSKPSDEVLEQIKKDLLQDRPKNSELLVEIPGRTATLDIKVLAVDGDVEILRPGSSKWAALNEEDAIPEGSRILTGMDADLLIYGKTFAAKVLSFSDVTISKEAVSKDSTNPNIQFNLDLRAGDVEVRAEKGSYQPSMQVRTPGAIAGVRGTHFYIAHNQKQRYSTIGVYEGQVDVQSLITGDKIQLSKAIDRESGIAFFPLQKP